MPATSFFSSATGSSRTGSSSAGGVVVLLRLRRRFGQLRRKRGPEVVKLKGLFIMPCSSSSSSRYRCSARAALRHTGLLPAGTKLTLLMQVSFYFSFKKKRTLSSCGLLVYSFFIRTKIRSNWQFYFHFNFILKEPKKRDCFSKLKKGDL